MTIDFIWFVSTASLLIAALICLLSPNVCMWIHKKHFEWKKVSSTEDVPLVLKEEKNTSDFTIEHYPLTGSYFPKYKEDYLTQDYSTGIVKIQPKRFFSYANSFQTEKGALEFIDKFKEHQLKVNVKIIPTNK